MSEYSQKILLRNMGIFLTVIGAIFVALLVSWPEEVALKRFLASVLVAAGIVLVIKSVKMLGWADILLKNCCSTEQE